MLGVLMNVRLLFLLYVPVIVYSSFIDKQNIPSLHQDRDVLSSLLQPVRQFFLNGRDRGLQRFVSRCLPF